MAFEEFRNMVTVFHKRRLDSSGVFHTCPKCFKIAMKDCPKNKGCMQFQGDVKNLKNDKQAEAYYMVVLAGFSAAGLDLTKITILGVKWTCGLSYAMCRFVGFMAVKPIYYIHENLHPTRTQEQGTPKWKDPKTDEVYHIVSKKFIHKNDYKP